LFKAMPEFRALLAGSGEMGECIRTHDWAATPFGRPADWPQSLRSALSMCLNSKMAAAIYWGPELRILYNSAWAARNSDRHPFALGRPGAEVWPDIWDVIGSRYERAFRDGQGYTLIDQRLPMKLRGRLEESYWTYNVMPIAGEDGGVAGILSFGQEMTERVLSDRRNGLLLALGDKLRPLDSMAEIVAVSTAILGEALGVGRVGYGETDEEMTRIRIEPCWGDGSLPDVIGAFPLTGFGGGLAKALRAGEVYAMEDRETDPRLTERDRAPYRALGIAAGLVAPVVRQGRYTAMLFAHNAQPREWTPHHRRLIADVAARVWQEVARTRAEAALRESEARHRLIFEQAHDIIFTADLDQRLTAANPAACTALGVKADALVGSSIAEFVTRETFDTTSSMLARKMARGGTTNYEVQVFARDGRPLRWEINSSLSIDGDGKPVGLHAIARDVTERHAYEERQRLLINELNHRVKNTLALVQGIALQSFRGRDAGEGQEVFQARLTALADAHDLLTRTHWAGATLAAVAADATRALGGLGGERISIAGPEVTLGPKAAVSFVLALHELGTNAAKYGALSTPTGRIAIAWAQSPAGRLTLEWRESGGPLVAPPKRRGFGLRMIERALAADLDGKVAIHFSPEGLICTLDAPMPAAPPAAA
jgi:PAS domain S-box-containing protein